MDKQYKTKDIYEAAWIYSQEVKLLRIEPDGRYFWFVFDDEKSCNSLSPLYWTQKASGNIKQFVNSFKTLKDLIFSQKEDPE